MSVLKNVTIGIGAFIHISKAYARLVSWGFTSFILNAIFHSMNQAAKVGEAFDPG
ncbi:hypothetical protein M079_3456 [Bacteroides fragilis str. 3996 N(B) 6]|nr:hypothetical protein M079_3456 [Bacteroides fragilis str. 3996 N(B) 6]